MMELYSTNFATTANQVITWNNKSVQRGISATLGGDGQTIYLNTPGVYKVTLSANGQTTANGTFGFTVNGNGNAIVRGTYSIDSAAGVDVAMSYPLYITVTRAYDFMDRAKITVTYTGGAGTMSLVDMVVEKVYGA